MPNANLVGPAGDPIFEFVKQVSQQRQAILEKADAAFQETLRKAIGPNTNKIDIHLSSVDFFFPFDNGNRSTSAALVTGDTVGSSVMNAMTVSGNLMLRLHIAAADRPGAVAVEIPAGPGLITGLQIALASAITKYYRARADETPQSTTERQVKLLMEAKFIRDHILPVSGLFKSTGGNHFTTHHPVHFLLHTETVVESMRQNHPYLSTVMSHRSFPKTPHSHAAGEVTSEGEVELDTDQFVCFLSRHKDLPGHGGRQGLAFAKAHDVFPFYASGGAEGAILAVKGDLPIFQNFVFQALTEHTVPIGEAIISQVKAYWGNPNAEVIIHLDPDYEEPKLVTGAMGTINSVISLHTLQTLAVMLFFPTFCRVADAFLQQAKSGVAAAHAANPEGATSPAKFMEMVEGYLQDGQVCYQNGDKLVCHSYSLLEANRPFDASYEARQKKVGA